MRPTSCAIENPVFSRDKCRQGRAVAALPADSVETLATRATTAAGFARAPRCRRPPRPATWPRRVELLAVPDRARTASSPLPGPSVRLRRRSWPFPWQLSWRSRSFAWPSCRPPPVAARFCSSVLQDASIGLLPAAALARLLFLFTARLLGCLELLLGCRRLRRRRGRRGRRRATGAAALAVGAAAGASAFGVWSRSPRHRPPA